MAGFTVARLLAAVMLVIAVGKHPYSYYTLMRFVVCLVAAYGAFLASERRQQGWLCTFGVLALLFNPFIPVRLDRSTWAVLDVAAAIAFGASLINRRLVDQTEIQSPTPPLTRARDQVQERVDEADSNQTPELEQETQLRIERERERRGIEQKNERFKRWQERVYKK